MKIYEIIKQEIPIPEAARRYGLTVSQSGMACCPFHGDTHPSLKLNGDYFFCFGCGATGDVIDFTSRLFGISGREAAQKLAADFGIAPGPPRKNFKQNIPQEHAEPFQNLERLCISVLSDYLRLLRIWRLRYEPKTPGEEFHDRFAESCRMSAYVDHLLDCLYSSIPEERGAVISVLTEGGKLDHLQSYVNQRKKEDEQIVQRRNEHCA